MGPRYLAHLVIGKRLQTSLDPPTGVIVAQRDPEEEDNEESQQDRPLDGVGSLPHDVSNAAF